MATTCCAQLGRRRQGDRQQLLAGAAGMTGSQVYRQPLLLGFAAGLVSGLFGVGGGVIMVPGLVLWFGLGPHKAHATSVTAIVGAAAAGMTPFAVSGDIDYSAVAIIFLGGAVGAFAGARLLGKVSAVWLTRGFVLVLLVASIRMAL